MGKVYIGIITIIFMLVGCKKVTLDSFAFPSEKLDAYQFDEYATPEIEIPAQYGVHSSMRTLVSFPSVDKETGDTYTIYGVYIGDMSTISTDTIIYYCHGQSRHMDYYSTRADLLANVGGKHRYGVFMIDYRGYGMSEGTSTEQSLYEDVDAGIEWLLSQGVTDDKTIYYGFSLGAIPTIDRSAYRTDFSPQKLIIEAPIASVENLVHSSTIINIDPESVTGLVFNNAEKIKAVQQELLWMHGVEDDYVAIENGELIFSNHAGMSKEAIRVEGSNHAEIPPVYGFENYLLKLEEFIQ